MKKIFVVFLLILLIPISAYSDVISDYFNLVQNKNLSGLEQLLYNPTPERLKIYKMVFTAISQRVNSIEVKKRQIFGGKAIVQVHVNTTITDKFRNRSFTEDNDLVFLLQKQNNRWKIAKVMPLTDFILKKKLLIIKNALERMPKTNGNQDKQQPAIYNTAEGGENFFGNNKNKNSYKPNNNYTYLGCFKDQGDPFGLRGRDLAAFGFGSDKMTPRLCMRECARRGYRYAGVQYSGYCFCDNKYGKYGRTTNCNTHCNGDKSKICGGTWANSIYDVSRLNVPRIYYGSGVEVNTDRPGMDYKSFNLPYPDYRLCQNACNKDPKCKAWTYVKPYTIQGPQARCSLKGSIPNKVRKSCCISGIKHAYSNNTKTFRYPTINGYRLDWCRLWAQDCGQGAADAFCRKIGFTRAIAFEEDYDIGARSPTYVIGSGKICNQSFCDGFKYITCTGRIFIIPTKRPRTNTYTTKQLNNSKKLNCKDVYKRYVIAYNKLVNLISKGKENTSEAVKAQRDYGIASSKYDSCRNAQNNQTVHYSIDKCAVYQNKQDYISLRYPEYLRAKKHYVNLTCSVYMLPKGSRIKTEWFYVLTNKDYPIGQKTVFVNRTSPEDKYVNFRIESDRDWPTGLYRVKIMLNGKEIKVIAFRMK